MTSYKIPYSKKQLEFEIPSEFKVSSAENSSKSTISDISQAARNAILNPINSKRLSELLENDVTVCIVITDITRPCPDKNILPELMNEIKDKIKPENLKLIIASGMHRKMTDAEKIEKYGAEIVNNYTILDHDAKDEENLISLGTTKNGTPIKISKTVCESDFKISIGLVEPHQYAGYSGGYKTLAIGVAGDETISKTHSRNFIEHKNTLIGKTDNNIFNDDIKEIGKKVGLDFIINVVLDEEKNLVDIKSGEPIETYNALVKTAKELSEITVSNNFDVVICGVGFPKDTNLYQTSRAASYLHYLPDKIVKKGGYIIIPASCEEGAGQGIGEQRFFEMLANMTIDEILNNKEEFKAGEQRAFMIANVLKHCKILIVGSTHPQIIKDAKMLSAENMSEAFEIVKNDLGNNLELLIIQNSLVTLPIIK